MILDSLLSVFFPRLCHVCGEKLSEGERSICSSCLESLPRTFYHRRDPNPMELLLASRIPIEHATALFFYSRQSALSQLVQDLKYRGFPRLGTDLGRIMGLELLSTGFFNDTDSLVPVPLHFLKKMKRGYNQSEMIARGISEITGIPVDDALCARRGHSTQTGKTPQERMRNTEGIFVVRDPSLTAGKHVMIIDDICTTGATLLSAAKAIHSASPGTMISVLTLGLAYD